MNTLDWILLWLLRPVLRRQLLRIINEKDAGRPYHTDSDAGFQLLWELENGGQSSELETGLREQGL